MKTFNHKKMRQLINNCVITGSDERDRGMSEATLKSIIEIMEDCSCFACIQLLPGYRLALQFFELDDLQSAGIAITQTLQKQDLFMTIAKMNLN